MKRPVEQFHVGERIRIRSPVKYLLEYAFHSFNCRNLQIIVTVVAGTYRREFELGLPFMKCTAMIPSTLCDYWMYKRLQLFRYWPQKSPHHLFLQHAIRSCNLRSARPLRNCGYHLRHRTWWVYPILIIVVEHSLTFF